MREAVGKMLFEPRGSWEEGSKKTQKEGPRVLTRSKPFDRRMLSFCTSLEKATQALFSPVSLRRRDSVDVAPDILEPEGRSWPGLWVFSIRAFFSFFLFFFLFFFSVFVDGDSREKSGSSLLPSLFPSTSLALALDALQVLPHRKSRAHSSELRSLRLSFRRLLPREEVSTSEPFPSSSKEPTCACEIPLYPESFFSLSSAAMLFSFRRVIFFCCPGQMRKGCAAWSHIFICLCTFCDILQLQEGRKRKRNASAPLNERGLCSPHCGSETAIVALHDSFLSVLLLPTLTSLFLNSFLSPSQSHTTK